MLIRALIVLLLVLNLGVALWWATRTPPMAAEAPPLPLGVVRLQLASEAAQPLPVRPSLGVLAADAAKSPAQVRELPRVCFSLGPFADVDAADRARRQLQPRVLRVERREVYAGPARGWNVSLPPFATIAEVEAAAKHVQAAGFSDYFIVRNGPQANSLALGRYGGESTARRRVAELSAAGFPARAEPIGGGRPGYWLDITATAVFDAVAAQASVAASGRQPLDCATLE